MFKASDEVTRARLRKLEQGKYIKSKSFPNLAGNPKAYMLLERAYDHLDIPYRRRKFPSPFFLAHSLDLITIQIHLENVWFADHPRVSIPWCFNESKMHLAEGKHLGKSQQRGRSTQKGGSEQTSETTTPQLVTFYQQMEQVASQYSLDEQRYRATALLQNLPVATAAIKIGNAPTEIVGIKYISPPNVRPGGKKWMLAQVQKQSCVLPYDQACKALDERHAQLFGVSEKPRGKTETPFQPKQKGKDDPDPFVF